MSSEDIKVQMLEMIIINPLNPDQFTRRVYRLPGAIRNNVPVSVSVSVFWQRKFR